MRGGMEAMNLESGIAPEVWALLAGCSDYQRNWFVFYVGVAGFNAAEATRMASTGPRTQGVSGYKTRNVPAVAAAIDLHLRLKGVTRERIVERLAQLAFADAGEALDEAGRFSAERMRLHKASALIRKITYHPEDKGGGIQSVEFASPDKALELLGRATEGGMFRDNARVEHSGEMGLAVEHRESFDYYRLSVDDLTELERLHVKGTGAAGAPALDAPGD